MAFLSMKNDRCVDQAGLPGAQLFGMEAVRFQVPGAFVCEENVGIFE
jgi:hypothetical protein